MPLAFDSMTRPAAPSPELSVSPPRFPTWQRVPRLARQLCVCVLGTVVLVAGVAMIVLPGPAVIVIPLGLAILATEFPWARRLLHWAKARLLKLKQAATRRPPTTSPVVDSV
jgi:uncharacterized protein (TIGR02611 family)